MLSLSPWEFFFTSALNFVHFISQLNLLNFRKIACKIRSSLRAPNRSLLRIQCSVRALELSNVGQSVGRSLSGHKLRVQDTATNGSHWIFCQLLCWPYINKFSLFLFLSSLIWVFTPTLLSIIPAIPFGCTSMYFYVLLCRGPPFSNLVLHVYTRCPNKINEGSLILT